MSGVEKGV